MGSMTNEEIAAKWLSEAKTRAITQYNALGLKASGKFEKELEDVVEVKPSGLRLALLGAQYTGVLISGRDKNKDQSKEGIRKFVGYAGNTFLKQWVKDKGLSISPFAVAYSIARKGIMVPNAHNSGALLDTAATDSDLDALGRELIGAKISDIRSEVANVLIHKK